MSKKQYDSSENEKQDQLEMSSEKKKTTSSPRTTTVKGAMLAETTENSLEMPPQHRQAERNETTTETHAQKEIKSGRKHKTKSKFIQLLIIRLSLWFTAAVLESFKHLPNKHFQPTPPLLRHHSHYKCIIKRILKKLNKINEISAHLNYLQLLKRISTWTANAYSWLRCRWPVVKCITESIAAICIVSSYILNAFKHNNLALSVIVHLRRILGICPIRLISLKRLPQQQQQIPKNHLKLDRGQEEEQSRQQSVEALIRVRQLATLRISCKIAGISLSINNSPAFVGPQCTGEELILTKSKQLTTLRKPCSIEGLSQEQTQVVEKLIPLIFISHERGSTANHDLATLKSLYFKQLKTLRKLCSGDQTQMDEKSKYLLLTNHKLESAEMGILTKVLLSQDIKRSIILSNYNQNPCERQLATLNKQYSDVLISQEQIHANGLLKTSLFNNTEKILSKIVSNNQGLATLKSLRFIHSSDEKRRVNEQNVLQIINFKLLLATTNTSCSNMFQLTTLQKSCSKKLHSQDHTQLDGKLKSLLLFNLDQSSAMLGNAKQKLATIKRQHSKALLLQKATGVYRKSKSIQPNIYKQNFPERLNFNQQLTTVNKRYSEEEQLKVTDGQKQLVLNYNEQSSADRVNIYKQLATLNKRYLEALQGLAEIDNIKQVLATPITSCSTLLPEEHRTFLYKNEQNLLQTISIKQELATPNIPCSDMFLLHEESQRSGEYIETTEGDSSLLISLRKEEHVNQELATLNSARLVFIFAPQQLAEEKVLANKGTRNSAISPQELATVTTVTPLNAISEKEENSVTNYQEFCARKDDLRILPILSKEINHLKEFTNNIHKKLVVTNLAGPATQNEIKDLATLKDTCFKLLTIQERTNAPKQPTNIGSEKEAKTKPKEHKEEVTTLERVRQEGAKEVIQLPTRHYRCNNKHYLVYEQPQNEHQKYSVEQTRHYRQQRLQHRHQPKRTESHHQEHKYQHILFVARCSWEICGFPLVSKEFFKYLLDLTERTFRATSSSSISSNDKRNSATLPLRIADDNGSDNVGMVKHGQDAVRQLSYPTDVIQQRNLDEVHQNAKTSWAKKNHRRTSDAASLPFTQSEETTSHLLTSPTSLSSPSSSSSSFFATFRPSRTPTSPPSSLYCAHYHHSNFHIKLPCSALPLSSSSSGGNTTTLLLLLLLLLSSMWHTSEAFHGSVKLSTNTIKTKYGLVRGIVVRSSPLVEAYLGIPYASPPVGSLRFMPPITPSTWKNVRNADRFSAVCPQTVPIPPNGPEALLEVPRARLAQLRRLLPLLSNQSEDCLYLNIYVPYENRRHRRFTTNSGEMHDQPLLPTILFLHGESYEWNSGNPYDGSELATHGNVIVVTINFRLGIFGFLKTGGKESAQGNFGLMDLVAGLHWLKENLPAFGGDPQAITLLGHGTGASLANILAVSPVASDLIHHVALVSGSALSPWAIQKSPLFVKRRVAEQTGCHGDMLYDDLAPCLRTKSVAELLAVKIDHPRFLVGFAPFIDGTVISPNTDYIGKLSLPMGSAIVSTSGIEYANFPKRNLIFCLTSVESHLDLSAQDLEFGFNETRRDRILRTYVRNNFHYHLNEIFAVLKNEYTDWEKAIRSPLSSRDATLQFLSDGHTASSLIKLGYMHSLRGGKGYFLHFKHRTVEEEYPQRTGSVRGEDVPFWLGLPISPLFPHNYTTQERQISRLMLRYLANFAKTGNPNQSSLSSPLPSSSTLIGSPSSVASSQTNEDHQKYKRSSLPKTPANIVNASSLPLSPSSSTSSSGSSNSQTNNSTAHTLEDVASAAAREALNLAVLYNQRRTKRTYFKRHSRSNTEDSHNGSGSGSSEVGYFLGSSGKLDGDEMPFWDAYDVVNQLYMELGNKAEIQSHYRGHKLSMWLNLIPQLHRHANMNDQSMRHHQFQDDLNNMNLYEGIVRAQIQIKPADDEETLLLPKGRPTTAPPPPPTPTLETNTTQKPSGGTTECGVDGAMFVAEMTTAPPTDNRSFIENREKEMATASTGLIGNLEVLRRLSGKQFQSYTTALVATVAVGCFLLILNILIFAGIYHQREKRARDAKTKEELQDNDTSKNSSILKLNALGSESGSFNGSGAGVSGKTTVVFGEYSCYDEKSVQTKDEKLMVDLPPSQMMDSNWAAACSTSTLDLLKTKHHLPLEPSYTMTSNIVPITTEQPNEHLMAVSAMEMATYNPLPAMVSGSAGLILDPSIATSSGLQSKRGSFVGSAGQLNQYDFASVQSSDQMSFKDIENAVKVSMTRDDDITQDDDIPEPPPPPKSFQNMQQLQQQQQQQQQAMASSATSGTAGGGGGGILRQAGTSSATQTGGGKKRVHIQEISV